MNGDARLMLIDGHALIHRAFHAVPVLTTSKGELVNAVFGVANILLKEMDELTPSHIIMAMDRPAPTFRHQQYAEYKATRAPTPTPLITQFARVRELAAALHIPIYELDGFEADDVLGTLARQAEAENLPVVIVTGDLDALQLVSDLVQVRTPGRAIGDSTLYDADAVRRRYGLEPVQLPDWKALVGDTSDNIPGVSGIGKTTASDLLARFQTLEGILAHIDEVPARRRDALTAGREQALQSRHLATIVRDVPITLSLEEAAVVDRDRSTVVDLFRELEFRSLIERIPGLKPVTRAADGVLPARAGQLQLFPDATTAAVPTSRPAEAETTTTVVDTLPALEDMLASLRASGCFAFDTETTAVDPLRAELVGLSFASEPGRAWYLPIGHAQGRQIPLPAAIERLRPLLEDPSVNKVAHNLKFDYAILKRNGLTVRGLAHDTMISAYLANPNGRGLSLSSLALDRFGLEMTPIEVLIGKGKTQLTMDLVDIDAVAKYAGADAAITLRLMSVLDRELADRELKSLFREVEMPLVSVLADMEMTGVTLDTEVLTEMSREMTEVIGRLEGAIYDGTGHRFNINSTQQLGGVLFGEMKLRSGRRTKTGYSTDNEVLEKLRGEHPVVDDILEYRQLLKLKNTYVDALPALINPQTGRVHTDFNQTVAATGRLSSSNPNLQNIPIRDEIGRKIRRAFVPSRPGNVLLAADYSQIELRIMASMSSDERLLHAFRGGEDVHRATAAAVFNVSSADVTDDQRRVAKVVNFGIMYGIGESRLAQETGISRTEAAEFIANYNQTYAGVKEFMDNLRRQAALYGYVSTLLNRRRYLPDIHSSHPGVRSAAERAAINMPIQGTAADVIKVAMIRLHRELRARFPEARMVLQVHDELVLDLPDSQLAEVAALVRETMVSAVALQVPLEVELKSGHDWYHLRPVELAG